jgi:hypothetical protein
VCKGNRPGFVTEIVQLAFNQIWRDYYLVLKNSKLHEFNTNKFKGRIDLTYALHKNDKRYIYSRPIGSVGFCAYGIDTKPFSYERLLKNKVVYKKSDLYAHKFPMFENLIKENKYYLDQFTPDADIHELFRKVVKKKYDWILTYDSMFKFYIEQGALLYKDVEEKGCLGKVNIYLAFDKAYLRSWELRNDMNKFLDSFMWSEDQKSLLNFYKIERPLK